MATLNILEWNINQRSSDTKNQDFLADERMALIAKPKVTR